MNLLTFVNVFFLFSLYVIHLNFGSDEKINFSKILSLSTRLFNDEESAQTPVMSKELAHDYLEALPPNTRNIIFRGLLQKVFDLTTSAKPAFFSTWKPLLTEQTLEILYTLAEKTGVYKIASKEYLERVNLLAAYHVVYKEVYRDLDLIRFQVDVLLSQLNLNNKCRSIVIKNYFDAIFNTLANHKVSQVEKVKLYAGTEMLLELPRDAQIIEESTQRISALAQAVIVKVLYELRKFRRWMTSGLLLNFIELLAEGLYCYGFLDQEQCLKLLDTLITNFTTDNDGKQLPVDWMTFHPYLDPINTFTSMFTDKMNAVINQEVVTFNALFRKRTQELLLESPPEGTFSLITTRNWRVLFSKLLAIKLGGGGRGGKERKVNVPKNDPLEPFLREHVKEDSFLQDLIIDMVTSHVKSLSEIYVKSDDTKTNSFYAHQLSVMLWTLLNVHKRNHIVLDASLPNHAICVEIVLPADINYLPSIHTPLSTIHVHIFNAGSGAGRHRLILHKQRSRIAPAYTFTVRDCSLLQLFTEFKCFCTKEKEEIDLVYGIDQKTLQVSKDQSHELKYFQDHPEQTIDVQSSGTCTSFCHMSRLRSFGDQGYVIEWLAKLLGLRHMVQMTEIAINEVLFSLIAFYDIHPLTLPELVNHSISKRHLLSEHCPSLLPYAMRAIILMCYLQEAVVELKNTAILEYFENHEERYKVLNAIIMAEYRAGLGASKDFRGYLFKDIDEIITKGTQEIDVVTTAATKSKTQEEALFVGAQSIKQISLKNDLENGGEPGALGMVEDQTKSLIQPRSLNEQAKETCDPESSHFDPYACLGLVYQVFQCPELDINTTCPELFTQILKWDTDVWQSISAAVTYCFFHEYWETMLPQCYLEGIFNQGNREFYSGLLGTLASCKGEWKLPPLNTFGEDQFLAQEEDQLYEDFSGPPNTKKEFEELAKSIMCRALSGHVSPLIRNTNWPTRFGTMHTRLSPLGYLQCISMTSSTEVVSQVRPLKEQIRRLKKLITEFSHVVKTNDPLHVHIQKLLDEKDAKTVYLTTQDYQIIKGILDKVLDRQKKLVKRLLHQLYLPLKLKCVAELAHGRDERVLLHDLVDNILQCCKEIKQNTSIDMLQNKISFLIQSLNVLQTANEAKEITFSEYFDGVFEKLDELVTLCFGEHIDVLIERDQPVNLISSLVDKHLQPSDNVFYTLRILYYPHRDTTRTEDVFDENEEKRMFCPTKQNYDKFIKFVQVDLEPLKSLAGRLDPVDRPVLKVPEWETLFIDSMLVHDKISHDTKCIKHSIKKLEEAAKWLISLKELLPDKKERNVDASFNPYRDGSQSNFKSLSQIEDLTRQLESILKSTVLERLLVDIKDYQKELSMLEEKHITGANRINLDKPDLRDPHILSSTRNLLVKDTSKQTLVNVLELLIRLKDLLQMTVYEELKWFVTTSDHALVDSVEYYIALKAINPGVVEYKDQRFVNLMWQLFHQLVSE